MVGFTTKDGWNCDRQWHKGNEVSRCRDCMARAVAAAQIKAAKPRKVKTVKSWTTQSQREPAVSVDAAAVRSPRSNLQELERAYAEMSGTGELEATLADMTHATKVHMIHSVFNMMSFVFKMMNFVLQILAARSQQQQAAGGDVSAGGLSGGGHLSEGGLSEGALSGGDLSAGDLAGGLAAEAEQQGMPKTLPSGMIDMFLKAATIAGTACCLLLATLLFWSAWPETCSLLLAPCCLLLAPCSLLLAPCALLLASC